MKKNTCTLLLTIFALNLIVTPNAYASKKKIKFAQNSSYRIKKQNKPTKKERAIIYKRKKQKRAYTKKVSLIKYTNKSIKNALTQKNNPLKTTLYTKKNKKKSTYYCRHMSKQKISKLFLPFLILAFLVQSISTGKLIEYEIFISNEYAAESTITPCYDAPYILYCPYPVIFNLDGPTCVNGIYEYEIFKIIDKSSYTLLAEGFASCTCMEGGNQLHCWGVGDKLPDSNVIPFNSIDLGQEDKSPLEKFEKISNIIANISVPVMLISGCGTVLVCSTAALSCILCKHSPLRNYIKKEWTTATLPYNQDRQNKITPLCAKEICEESTNKESSESLATEDTEYNNSYTDGSYAEYDSNESDSYTASDTE